MANNLFLFTYQTNIKGLELDNDIGWGCMARSSQMLISKIIFDYYVNDRKKVIDIMTNELSFTNLIKHCQKEYNYKIGDFMKFTTCLLSYEYLINYYLNTNFKVLTFVDNSFDLYKLYSFINKKDYNQDNININNFDNWNCKLIINISIVLGIDKTNIIYKNQFFNLINNKWFLGFLGGQNKSGYFYYKLENEYLYYLDPHFNKIYTTDHTQYISNQEDNKILYEDISPFTMFSFIIYSYDDLKKILNLFENNCDIINIINEKFSYNSDDIILF